MQSNEKKLFKKAAILYLILIVLIYLGSFLKYSIVDSWYGTGAVIMVIFIWVTILLIATIISAKGVYLIKERWRGKERLDFVAKLGTLAAEYFQLNDKMEVNEFFERICKENGVMAVPDLKKYSDKNFGLKDTRQEVFEELRDEIEESADSHSLEKI